jgi:hypothetical protein
MQNEFKAGLAQQLCTFFRQSTMIHSLGSSSIDDNWRIPQDAVVGNVACEYVKLLEYFEEESLLQT